MKNIRYIFFTAFFLLLTHLSVCMAMQPILLDSAASYPLSNHIEILVDHDNSQTLSKLFKYPQRFTPISGDLNLGYNAGTIWLRFDVQRTPNFPERAYLRLGPPFLDSIDVYIQSGNNPFDPEAYNKFETGDHVPLNKQSARSTDFLIPFNLPQGQSRIIYLRIQTTSSLALSGVIQTSDAAIAHNTKSLLLNGGYTSVALVIFLINMVIYIRIRDPIFLYFALYVMSQCLNHIAIAGILPIIFPYTSHLFSDYLTGASFGLSICVFVPFAIHLFNLPAGSWSRRFFCFYFLYGTCNYFFCPIKVLWNRSNTPAYYHALYNNSAYMA